jgi:hypothetical protein
MTSINTSNHVTFVKRGLNISNKVRDRGKVSTDHKQEVRGQAFEKEILSPLRSVSYIDLHQESYVKTANVNVKSYQF